MTVEHLIGKGQGGYLKDIRLAVAERFPALDAIAREDLSRAIDSANTVTACSFCNSTTSRDVSDVSMTDLIRLSEGNAMETMSRIQSALCPILERKRADVKWKLESVRNAYAANFLPRLPASTA